MTDLAHALAYGAAYGLLGTVALIGAWFVLDLLTPGRLGDHLHRSHSAGVIAATWMLAQGAVVACAIWTNAQSGFGAALEWTIAFSILGILLQTLAWKLVDVVTPGRLGEEVTVPGDVVPMARVSAGAIVAVAAIVIASIS